MNKKNTLPLNHVILALERLGFECIESDSTGSGQKNLIMTCDNTEIVVPVQHGRCHQATLLNSILKADAIQAQNVSYNTVKRVCSGEDAALENEKRDILPLSALPSLPRELAKRSVTKAQMKSLFKTNEWGLVVQRGSHFGYAPAVAAFKGNFSLTHHGGEKAVLHAQHAQAILSHLMNRNTDPQARDAIMAMHKGLIDHLKS